TARDTAGIGAECKGENRTIHPLRAARGNPRSRQEPPCPRGWHRVCGTGGVAPLRRPSFRAGSPCASPPCASPPCRHPAGVAPSLSGGGPTGRTAADLVPDEARALDARLPRGAGPDVGGRRGLLPV